MNTKTVKTWLTSLLKTSGISFKLVGHTLTLNDDIHEVRLNIQGGTKDVKKGFTIE